jgi:MFS family permease
MLLMLRIGSDASYVGDVLPAVLVFGFGMTVLVAPLTATVLAAAPNQHAGAASGVNNAVARSAGLLAVALLPPVAGLTGAVYRDPVAFADGFRTAALIGSAMLILGGLLSAVGIRNHADEPENETEHCYSCPFDGPRLETVQPRVQRTT